MEVRALHEVIDMRYADRGGWKNACESFAAQLPYESKIDYIKDHFRISRSTAVRWYGHYRSTVGLR